MSNDAGPIKLERQTFDALAGLAAAAIHDGCKPQYKSNFDGLRAALEKEDLDDGVRERIRQIVETGDKDHSATKTTTGEDYAGPELSSHRAASEIGKGDPMKPAANQGSAPAEKPEGKRSG